MTRGEGDFSWSGLLPVLPPGLRVTLTAMLGIIGCGYLIAIANIVHSHGGADGKPGLTLDDVRAVYSGLTVNREDGVIASRMLTMLHGSMREYVEDDADFEVLDSWLKAGGTEAGLDEGEKRKTPRRALIRNCMRCHAESSGTDIAGTAPFGPDEFEVDYAKLTPFLASVGESTETEVFTPPQYTVPRLVLISHIHMLAIPMFALVLALLFSMTRLPAAWRRFVTPLPMLALVVDFSSWWLARTSGVFVLFIVAAGGVFGLAFGFQLIAVLWDLWRPRRRAAE